MAQSGSGEGPSQASPAIRYEGPTWWERNRRILYEIAKIFQICVCLLFIIIGIIMCIYNVFSSHDGDDDFYWWPWRKDRRFRYRKGRLFKLDQDDLWYSYFFYSLWLHTVTSICGLVGAAGEVLWCQLVYAIVVTVSIGLTLFSPVAWFITVGILQNWSKPFYHYYYPVYA